MLEKLSSWSSRIYMMVNRERENSALRARVEALEKELLVCQTEMAYCSGRVTELLVPFQEVLLEHPECERLAQKESLVEVWSDGFWYEKHSPYLKTLALIYLRLMQLNDKMLSDGDSDGLKTDSHSLSTGRTVRLVG